MARILAFDTATERAGAALGLGDEVFAVEALLRLLDEAGVALKALDAIAFGRGPGAFTGLRTACSVAQGLALGASLPVIAVDTLAAIAEDARSRAVPDAPHWRVWVLLDARMDELYAAEYRFGASGWETVVEPLLAAPEVLARRWAAEPPAAAAGEALATFAPRLGLAGLMAVPDARPRAEALLRVARQLHMQGGAVDPALALPLYVRNKVALTSAERAARVAA
jgi:tRNA threonylcarbamoyladenosine biosynthesis protein TsaB